MIIKVLHESKEEIKGHQEHQKGVEDSLYQILIACFSIVTKFFETLKKQLKKAEQQVNIGASQVGHLVPLTVGHGDRPTGREESYIQTLLNISDFNYAPPTGMVMSEGIMNGIQDPLVKMTLDRFNTNSHVASVPNTPKSQCGQKINRNTDKDATHNLSNGLPDIPESPSISRIPRGFMGRVNRQQK